MRLAAIFGCMYLHATVYLCSQVRRYLGSTRGVGVITASIVGATGFTGMVLTDLLDRHPEVRLDALTSVSYAGRTVPDLFPQLRVRGAYVEYAAERVADSEYVFVCYPHAAAHPVVAELLDAGHKVVDLSADFRLSEPDAYPRWYGFEHPRVDLLGEAVYGIPEVYRDAVAHARLVANPGCFPTVSLLAALPLLRLGSVGRVIVDAKSGVSGAGRSPSQKTHFCTVQDDFRAYGELGHRHTSEMLQEMGAAAGRSLPVSFTPHLLPVDRGILATVYCIPGVVAAPVVVSRKETALPRLAAVAMNSGNANACTGAEGLAVARAMQSACATGLELPVERVGVASTGIIGVPLDQERLTAGVRGAVAELSRTGGARFAAAIMTTDRFDKAVALEFDTPNGAVRVGACAKGAGMIAPGMATMLCVVTTDALVPPTVASSLLSREVGHTFNRVTVDGEMSTNDSVFFLASGASGVELVAEGVGRLGSALRYALLRLALMMVADGEGATKVMRLRVDGAPDDEDANLAARAIADSTLVKTALYGCDPSWGLSLIHISE